MSSVIDLSKSSINLSKNSKAGKDIKELTKELRAIITNAKKAFMESVDNSKYRYNTVDTWAYRHDVGRYTIKKKGKREVILLEDHNQFINLMRDNEVKQVFMYEKPVSLADYLEYKSKYINVELGNEHEIMLSFDWTSKTEEEYINRLIRDFGNMLEACMNTTVRRVLYMELYGQPYGVKIQPDLKLLRQLKKVVYNSLKDYLSQEWR